MQLVTEVNGDMYAYTENFWTGKKELTLNGEALQKKDKKTFVVVREGAERSIGVKGNFLTGVTLVTDTGNIELVKNKWYDWVLIFLPLIGVALGIFCGMIGGGLSALFGVIGAVANATLLRSKVSFPLRVLGCILVAVIVNVLWFLICLAIAGGISKLF